MHLKKIFCADLKKRYSLVNFEMQILKVTSDSFYFVNFFHKRQFKILMVRGNTYSIEHYSEYVNMPRCKKAIKVNKSTFISVSFIRRRSFLLFDFQKCSYIFSSFIKHHQ